MDEFTEENTKNMLINSGLDSWFSTRIAVWSTFLVLIPSYTYILYHIYTTPGGTDTKKLVIFITKSTGFSTFFVMLLKLWSQFETSMVVVERCKVFEEVDPELGYREMEEEKLKFSVPKTPKKLFKELQNELKTQPRILTDGSIELKNINASYPTSVTQIFKKLNLKISEGIKIGIVGRTGAGKSSLVKLIASFLKPRSGTIKIGQRYPKNEEIKKIRKEITIIS